MIQFARCEARCGVWHWARTKHTPFAQPRVHRALKSGERAALQSSRPSPDPLATALTHGKRVRHARCAHAAISGASPASPSTASVHARAHLQVFQHNLATPHANFERLSIEAQHVGAQLLVQDGCNLGLEHGARATCALAACASGQRHARTQTLAPVRSCARVLRRRQASSAACWRVHGIASKAPRDEEPYVAFLGSIKACDWTGNWPRQQLPPLQATASAVYRARMADVCRTAACVIMWLMRAYTRGAS